MKYRYVVVIIADQLVEDLKPFTNKTPANNYFKLQANRYFTIDKKTLGACLREDIVMGKERSINLITI